MDPLGTDSCRGIVPMEPPMCNGSRHAPSGTFKKNETDDTRDFLQGASCTILIVAINHGDLLP
jgi:hypothetical protein